MRGTGKVLTTHSGQTEAAASTCQRIVSLIRSASHELGAHTGDRNKGWCIH